MEINPLFRIKAFFSLQGEIKIVCSILIKISRFFLGGLLVISGPIFFDLDALMSESIF